MSDCLDCDNDKKFVFVKTGETKTSRKINELVQNNVPFVEVDLFSINEPQIQGRDGEEILPSLSLKKEALYTLYASDSQNFTMNVPGPNNEILKLLLTKVEIYDPDFKVTDGINVLNIPLGHHYFGVVEGKESSRVIVNIFNEEISGIITIDEDPIEIRKEKTSEINYLLLRTNEYRSPLNCNTVTSNIERTIENEIQIQSRAPSAKQIRMYIDALNSNMSDITSIFTAVADIYLNDPFVEVIVTLSGIALWTTFTLPFTYVAANGADGANLEFYSAYRALNPIALTDAYHFIPVDPDRLAGIAWLDVLCATPVAPLYVGPFAISVVETGSTPVPPVYSWNASTVAHELGHNIGSPHTFACLWAGVSGYNGSAGTTGFMGANSLGGCNANEGGCSAAPTGGYLFYYGPSGSTGSTGLSGETIMGYCQNYSPMLFGPQPGTLVRQRVDNASCLVCVHPNTMILMFDGTEKRIKDLKRGDLVASDLDKSKSYKISRVNIAGYRPSRSMQVAVFEIGCLGENMPNQKLTITGYHPIFYKGSRREAQYFKDLPGVTYYEKIEGKDLFEIENGLVNLYDLQFDEEGSYVANGVQVQSRCPWSIHTPLPKELYFDISWFREEKVEDNEGLYYKIPFETSLINV